MLAGVIFISGYSIADQPKDPSAEVIAKYTKLRWEVFDQKGYTPDWSHNAEREALLDMLEQGSFDEFLKASEEWLKKISIDIQIHDARAHVFRLNGDFRESMRSALAYTGLLASIMNESDGKTPVSAFQVTSIREIYAVIEEMGLERTEQKLLPSGHDMLTCRNEEGNEVILYFDVRRMMEKRAAHIKATTEAEQAGTGQPATRPESKSEGSDKPQPEAEGRSR
jgi:hypothetical protein